MRACPFCRELYADGEQATCAVCAVALVPFERLAPSREVLDEDGALQDPASELLPRAYWRRGRGLLAAFALFGLAAFVSPWVHVTMPDITTYSGMALARRLGWPWGAGVAWFVLLPVVLSRRTIAKMRGARVAACFLSAVPGTTAALLLALPPHGSHGVPVRFTFGWGVHATLALSVIALGLALFFGGRIDDVRVRRGTSAGQVVH